MVVGALKKSFHRHSLFFREIRGAKHEKPGGCVGLVGRGGNSPARTHVQCDSKAFLGLLTERDCLKVGVHAARSLD